MDNVHSLVTLHSHIYGKTHLQNYARYVIPNANTAKDSHQATHVPNAITIYI